MLPHRGRVSRPCARGRGNLNPPLGERLIPHEQPELEAVWNSVARFRMNFHRKEDKLRKVHGSTENLGAPGGGAEPPEDASHGAGISLRSGGEAPADKFLPLTGSVPALERLFPDVLVPETQ